MVYSEELGYDPEEWEECEEPDHILAFAPFTRILLATIAIAFAGFFFWLIDTKKEWNKIEKTDKGTTNEEPNDETNNKVSKVPEESSSNGNVNIVINDNKRLSDHYTTETILHTINPAIHSTNEIGNREEEQKISRNLVMEQFNRNTDSEKLGKTDNVTQQIHSSIRLVKSIIKIYYYLRPNKEPENSNVIYSNKNYQDNDISNDASISLERTYKELADKIYHKFSKQLQTDIGTIPALNDFSNYKDLANSLTELYDKDIKQAMEDVISQGGSDIDAQNLKHKLQEHIKDAVYQHSSFDKPSSPTTKTPTNIETDRNSGENEDKKSSDSDNGFVKIETSEDELKKESSDVSYEKIEMMYDYSNERHSAPIFDDDDPSIHLKPELETISERAAEEVNILLQEYYDDLGDQKFKNDKQKTSKDTPEIKETFKEIIKPESPVFAEVKGKDIAPEIPQHRAIVYDDFVDETVEGKHYNIGIQLPQQSFDRTKQQHNIFEDNNMLLQQQNLINMDQQTFVDIENKIIDQLKQINKVGETPQKSSTNESRSQNKPSIEQIDSIEIINPFAEGIDIKQSQDIDALLKDYVQTPEITHDKIDNSYKDEPIGSINDAVVVIENFLAEATNKTPPKDIPSTNKINIQQKVDKNISPSNEGRSDITNRDSAEGQQNLSQYDELINKATADIYLQDAIDYVETQSRIAQTNTQVNNNFVIEEHMLEKDSNNLKPIHDNVNVLTQESTSNIVKTNDVFEKVEICIDEVDDTITYAPEIQSLEIPPDQLSQASEHVTDNNIEPIPEDVKQQLVVDTNIPDNIPILGDIIPPDGTLTRRDHSKSPLQPCFGEAPRIRRSHGARNDDMSSLTSRSEAKKGKSQSSLLSALGVTSTQEMLLRLTSLDELSQAMKKAGLESTNLIFGIDYTASNKYQGENSFDGKNLHTIDSAIENPYQQVIKIMGKTLAPFATQKGIPVYGFGDAATGDWSVFKIKKDGECRNLNEVLEAYNHITPDVNLSGPTNFAPLIHQAMEICAFYKEYFILVIIADGQVTNEKATRRAIVQACNYPLSIIVVGVGDGPWEMMKVFDESLPKRPWDNFHFVEFHDIIRRKANSKEGELSFAIHSLLEIPDQYNYVRRAGLMRRNENMK
uniref:VWFA domain-containing protein n=1 Tax=Parastrongyloides trichosuri TaxID=131310 RepID=A0A0N4ZHW8_PARTI